MSCETCTQTKAIASCVTDLQIGSLTAETTYWVYIQNLTTGRITKVEATTNADGLLLIGATYSVSGLQFMAEHTYKLWVTLPNANVSEMENITIDSIVYTCFYIKINRILGTDNVSVTYYLQTLEAV